MGVTDHSQHWGTPEHSVDAAFWEECYRKGDTFWDHGAPSPDLVDFLSEQKYVPGKILVPGCGLGHDCRELARHGFTVTGMDIAPGAVAGGKKLTKGLAVEFLVGDCLNPLPEFRYQFDWLFEHTCFCAINPQLRDRYVTALLQVLKPAGNLIGIFYNIQPESGPPFGTTRAALVERFAPYFDLIHECVPRSYENRQGQELLMWWRRNGRK